jgi:hypothetical protein
MGWYGRNVVGKGKVGNEKTGRRRASGWGSLFNRERTRKGCEIWKSPEAFEVFSLSNFAPFSRDFAVPFVGVKTWTTAKVLINVDLPSLGWQEYCLLMVPFLFGTG